MYLLPSTSNALFIRFVRLSYLFEESLADSQNVGTLKWFYERNTGSKKIYSRKSNPRSHSSKVPQLSCQPVRQ